jgi:hypothetical protein
MPFELRNELSRCVNAMEHYGATAELDEAYAPSVELRAALERRAAELRASFQAAGVEAAAGFVLWIFRLFPDFSGGGSGAKLEAGAYAEHLAEFPTWALRFVLAKVENSGAAFRPSVPVLRGYAREALRPAEKELRDIEAVLKAAIVSGAAVSAKRREIGAMMRTIASKVEPPAKLSRGQLMAPETAKRMAGDAASVPLSAFVTVAREVKFAPARKSTSARAGDD